MMLLGDRILMSPRSITFFVAGQKWPCIFSEKKIKKTLCEKMMAMILYFCKRGGHFEAQKIIDLRGILL